MAEPLDDGVLDLWMSWLNIIFRADITPEQNAAYRAAFKRYGFTNGDVMKCGRWIEANLFRFPVLADWLQCPDLPSNEDKVFMGASPDPGPRKPRKR